MNIINQIKFYNELKNSDFEFMSGIHTTSYGQGLTYTIKAPGVELYLHKDPSHHMLAGTYDYELQVRNNYRLENCPENYDNHGLLAKWVFNKIASKHVHK